MGDSALVRVALHAPPDGPLALGALLAGTLDFRSSQEAAAADPASPRCVQARPRTVLFYQKQALSRGVRLGGVCMVAHAWENSSDAGAEDALL